jgi:hypothetical protein
MWKTTCRKTIDEDQDRDYACQMLAQDDISMVGTGEYLPQGDRSEQDRI